MKLIILREKLPDKEKWLAYMVEQMNVRTFHDKIKGCVDIDHTKIEPFFKKLLLKKGLDITIDKAWIHFMAPGSDHRHGHEHSHDTGVYYLQIPENSGLLHFNKTKEFITPEEDMLVVVPKLITHSMTENKSNGVRIAMAFAFTSK